jgi:hypothetical protein
MATRLVSLFALMGSLGIANALHAAHPDPLTPGNNIVSIIPGSPRPVASEPTVLVNTDYSGFLCSTFAAFGGYPVQPTSSPTIRMTHPATVQWYEPFDFDSSFDRANPATYVMGPGMSQTVHATADYAFLLPVPNGAGQTAIELIGGTWNTSRGAAPSIYNGLSLRAAAGAIETGIPGGNPATIDFPTVRRKLVAVGDAGSSISMLMPGSGVYTQPSYSFKHKYSTAGTVTVTYVVSDVGCIPGGGSNETVSTINIVPLQPQLTLSATPNTVDADSNVTLTVSQTSEAGLLSGGIIRFKLVGGETVHTGTLINGSASVTVSAPPRRVPSVTSWRWKAALRMLQVRNRTPCRCRSIPPSSRP